MKKRNSPVIAFASGKGGAGKTSLSVAFAESLSWETNYFDCDVEEPDSGIFLKPQNLEEENIYFPLPEIIHDKCTGCNICKDFCNYNAIIGSKPYPIIFPELCHGCGGCSLVCQVNAINEAKLKVGTITKGVKNNINWYQGLVSVGDIRAPYIISNMLEKYIDKSSLTLIDCPPGCACSFSASVRYADYVVLVAESSLYGLHDIKLVKEAVDEMKIPSGIIINRSSKSDCNVMRWALEENIKVLGVIPEDKKIAVAYSKGKGLLTIHPEYKRWIQDVVEKIIKMQVIK